MKKNDFNRILLTAFSCLLLFTCVTVGANAQDVPAPAGGLQTLSGVIRWKTENGTTPLTRDDPNSSRNECASFYVRAMDPTQNDKIVWFTNVLEWGGERSGYFVCKYQMTVPANRRLKIVAGIGDAFYIKTKQVIPLSIDSLIRDAKKARFYFKPSSMEVTLGKKGMYLAFELLYYPGLR